MPSIHLLTPKDVCEILSVSIETLNNWREANTGPKYIKMGERKNSPIRYRQSEVEDWLKKNEKKD